MRSGERSNAPLFWGVLGVVVALDVWTKYLAERHLTRVFGHVEVLGDWLRLTLVYNPGAAFGLRLGPYSRWIFMALTVAALVILWRLLQATRPGDRVRTLAISLVCGGAIGNLIDRVRSEEGVVDFLDVGVGAHRWPTFNVADMAVSGGAFLLAWVLWKEEKEAEEAERLAELEAARVAEAGSRPAPQDGFAAVPLAEGTHSASPRDVA